MAPPGRKRSRRRPTFVGLIESCKQQNCEAAARQVAVARLTRPAERGFRNQRESLPATRGETAAPAHLSRRLEQDLLSLVCEKRDGQRARQRLSSPSPQRPRQKGRSRESRGSRVQRRRKSSRPRRAARSPSSSPSLSSSDRSREERLRSPRRRSHRSGSSDERSPETRAPPAAPMVRASFRRNARQFSPPAPSSGDVIGSGGGSAGCRQPKLANEKREQHILVQSLLQLHNALDAKRRQLPWGKSVLADVRSYCREVARQAQSEVPSVEEGLSPSPQPQPMVEQEEAVPDPNFIVVDEEPGDDEVLFMELSSESSQTASPASSLLPDSPRGQQQLPWREEEEGEGERLSGPEEEDVEEAADVVASVEDWQPGGDNNAAAVASIPGTSASSFLVPWNRPAAAQAGPRLAPEPAPWVPSSSSCSSRRQGAVAMPEPGAAVRAATAWGRRAPLLPTPAAAIAAARPVQRSISWREGAYLPTAPAPARPSMPSLSGRSSWRALPPSTASMFSGTLQAPPPPRLPPPAWQRPAEEFITVMEPAGWRAARRCFSPSPDYIDPLPLQYQPHLRAPAPRPMYTNRGHQSAGRYRMEGAWRFSGRRMF